MQKANKLLAASASSFDAACSIVKNIEDAISTLEGNALDWDGGEYIDVRKEDFDNLIKKVQGT